MNVQTFDLGQASAAPKPARMAFRLCVLLDKMADNRLGEELRERHDVSADDVRAVATAVNRLAAATPECKEQFCITSREYGELVHMTGHWNRFSAYKGKFARYVPMGRDMNYVS